MQQGRPKNSVHMKYLIFVLLSLALFSCKPLTDNSITTIKTTDDCTILVYENEGHATAPSGFFLVKKCNGEVVNKRFFNTYDTLVSVRESFLGEIEIVLGQKMNVLDKGWVEEDRFLLDCTTLENVD